MEICETIEISCSELYHYFSNLFRQEREMLLLWLKMAMEDENHAKQFALLSKLRRHNVIESLHVELVDAEVTLIYVQSLIEKVRSQPPTLEEALRLAINLEQKLVKFQMENVVTFSDESCERSFLAMASAGNTHLEALQETYSRLISP